MDLPKWVTARGPRSPLTPQTVITRQLAKNLLSPSARVRITGDADCTCRYCGRLGDMRLDPDGRTWQMDHVVPLSRGGSIDLSNVALACAGCNRLKGSMTADEFMQARG